MKKAKLLGSEPRRSREWLRTEETRAAVIRKRLKSIEKRYGRRFRGIMDDAVKLAGTIEHLARFGQSRSAEEAVEIAFDIELLSSLLEAEIDQILAS
ncbi:MAG: hypothetical protein WD738_02795 [Pirellulales bacterium]